MALEEEAGREQAAIVEKMQNSRHASLDTDSEQLEAALKLSEVKVDDGRSASRDSVTPLHFVKATGGGHKLSREIFTSDDDSPMSVVTPLAGWSLHSGSSVDSGSFRLPPSHNHVSKTPFESESLMFASRPLQTQDQEQQQQQQEVKDEALRYSSNDGASTRGSPVEKRLKVPKGRMHSHVTTNGALSADKAKDDHRFVHKSHGSGKNLRGSTVALSESQTARGLLALGKYEKHSKSCNYLKDLEREDAEDA